MTGQNSNAKKPNRFLFLKVFLTLLFFAFLYVIFLPVYDHHNKQKQLKAAFVEMSNISVLVDASVRSMENKPIILNIDNWQRFSLIKQVELLQTTDQIILTGVMGKDARKDITGTHFVFSRKIKDVSWDCKVEELRGEGKLLPRGCGFRR